MSFFYSRDATLTSLLQKVSGKLSRISRKPCSSGNDLPGQRGTLTAGADVQKSERENVHLSTLPAIFTAKVNIWSSLSGWGKHYPSFHQPAPKLESCSVITETWVHLEFCEGVQADLDQPSDSPGNETSRASGADATLACWPGAAARWFARLRFKFSLIKWCFAG